MDVQLPVFISTPSISEIQTDGIYAGRSTGDNTNLYVGVTPSQGDIIYGAIHTVSNGSTFCYISLNNSPFRYYYQYGVSSVSNYSNTTYTYDGITVCAAAVAIRNNDIGDFPLLDSNLTYQQAIVKYYQELTTVKYPITYSYTNSAVSGPTKAAVGDTVIISAVPDVGYGITDASTQILVTNDDVAVPYTWDAVNQRITFTMPQPATNRGGFGSTGQ